MSRSKTMFRIEGAVRGGLWWPMGALAFKPVSFGFSREGGPWISQAATLEEAVETLLTAEGGDFSTDVKLTGDSVLVVEKRTASRVTKRWFPVVSLPSIAGLVDADAIPDIELYG